MSSRYFLVTGGFFDGGCDGYVGELELRRRDGVTSMAFEPRLTHQPTDPALRVPNKGFTGGTILDRRLWVCGANQVLAFDVERWSLVEQVDDPAFNDLHHVLAEEQGLTVVNTGLESVDVFDRQGVLQDRVLLTSDARTRQRLERVAEFRTCDSNPHFMHASHCARTTDDGLLLTLVRQRRVVDCRDWSWASPEYPAPPHDGFLAEHAPSGRCLLWATTVAGEIFASDPFTLELIEHWSLPDRGGPVGWTRGLCVLDDGVLVGTTRIRANNAEYFQRWTSRDHAQSRTALAFLPFDDRASVVAVDVFPKRPAKVFSILRVP